MGKIITTTIQRCKLLNRPARLAVSDSQSLGLANWASLTRYTAIATLALAIVATMILNIVGGGLSRLDHQAVGAVDDNGADSLATTDQSSISLTISGATGGSPDQSNVVIKSPEGGGIATGGHTITVHTGTGVVGYTVVLHGSGGDTALVPSDLYSNNTLINPVGNVNGASAPLTNPTTLGTNEWGIAIPNSPLYPNFNTEADYQSTNQDILANTTYAAIPSKSDDDSDSLIINHSTSPAASGGDSINIYYGVRTTSSTQADTYSTELTYTATAILPPAPSITSITPNTFYLTSGNDGTIKLTGSNSPTPLSSITNVYVDLNNNGQLDTGNAEECRDLTLDPSTSSGASTTTLICTMPSDVYRESLGLSTTAGTYPIRLIYSGGDIATNLAYSYKEPSRTISADSTINLPSSGSSSSTNRQLSICTNGVGSNNDCLVDIDTNMIPIKYVGTHSNPKWVVVTNEEQANNTGLWYNYSVGNTATEGGGAKWANAVTVTAGSLAEYQQAMTGTNPNVEVDNNDVLGYWTYIPRYAYEVQRRDAVDKPVDSQDFNIVFQTANEKNTPLPTTSTGTDHKDYRESNQSHRTYTPGASQNPNSSTTWATHPAFSWGNTELNGLWVGKYETTGKITAPTVKPNQHANISEYIGNFYLAAKSIGVYDPNNVGGGDSVSSTDSAHRPNLADELTQNSHHLNTATSHMLKNSEWGAITYLAHSAYGAGINTSIAYDTNVQRNSAYPNSSADADGASSRYGITGCGPASANETSSRNAYSNGTPLNADTIESSTACSTTNTERSYNGNLGVLASTTNNTYGIYDTSGGAYEYMTSSYTTTNQSFSSNYFTTKANTPYVDLYKRDDGFNSRPDWSSGSSSQYYNYDVCTFETCGGSSTYETNTVQSVSGDYQSWGESYSLFVNSGSPWFSRGGSSNSGSASPFYTNYINGSTYASSGFRSALLASPSGQ